MLKQFFVNFDEVVSGGGIIYDSDLENISSDDVHTLDDSFKERLHRYLESKINLLQYQEFSK